MGYLIAFSMVLVLTTLTTSFLVKKSSDKKTLLAEDYARNYLVNYYLKNGKFPDSFSISWYPYLEYVKSSTKAVVRLAGKDRKLNTPDDVVVTVTEQTLKETAEKERERRARVLEQMVYSLCQRRLSQKQYPIFPDTLSQLKSLSGLPDWYFIDPITGKDFIYDKTTCKDDYCYCESAVIYAGDAHCPAGYSFNSDRSRCEASPVCPAGGSYDGSLDLCTAAPTASYTCSINGNSYSSLTDCNNNCYATTSGTCTEQKRWVCDEWGKWGCISGHWETDYKCGETGNVYDTLSICQSSCYSTTYGSCSSSYTCPSGYTYDSGSGKCVASPSCPNGGSLDTVNDVCVP